MKSVIALALAGVAVAVPAGWNDAPVDPVKVTTTAASTTWDDAYISKTTTKPVVASTTSTWADVSIKTTTKPVDPTTTGTWADVSITTTKPVDPTTTWGDAEIPSSETTSTVTAITTVCKYATTFTDKGDVYTATAGQTYVLTKGPYTVTIPIYEETKTVCDTPVAPTGAASTWVDASVPVAPTGSASSPVSPTGGKPGSPAANTPVSPYTGAASKMAGAGLAGVAAIAALLL